MLICVDPAGYASAARVFGDHLASDVHRVVDDLVGDLAGVTRVAGSDPAGVAWAEAYDSVSSVTAQAIDDLGRASTNVGALLQQSGFNHARADAFSDVTGGEELPPDSLTYVPRTPRGIAIDTAAGGSIADPPVGWEWLRDVCGLVWPDGDPGRLREMGAAWRRAAEALDAGWVLVSQGISALDEQESPEIESARGVCRIIGDSLSELAAQCRAIGASCDELADHIEAAHSELITEINLMLASIIAIELAAAAAGALTAGAGAFAMQAAAFGTVVATGTRISLILTRLLEAATLTGTPMVWKSADAVGDGLRTILSLTPKVAEAAPVAGTLKALDDLANRLSNSAWPMPPVLRGFDLEARMGGNLPPGFPTIDKFDWSTGLATSIKTVNLASKTYQDPARLERLLMKYVDKMAAFKGAFRGGFTIVEAEVKMRVLHLAVPRLATEGQQSVLDSMLAYAAERGVELKTEVIR